MIVRAGQRRQHEKRRLVRFDFVLEKTHVLGDLFLGIPGQADDVAGMHQHAGVVPFFDDAAIFFDFILLLAFGREVLRIDAFHADENLSAAGSGRQRDEVFRLRARSTCIMKETSSPSSRSLMISSKVSRQSFLRAKLSSVKK